MHKIGPLMARRGREGQGFCGLLGLNVLLSWCSLRGSVKKIIFLADMSAKGGDPRLLRNVSFVQGGNNAWNFMKIIIFVK